MLFFPVLRQFGAAGSGSSLTLAWSTRRSGQDPGCISFCIQSADAVLWLSLAESLLLHF
ncbi:hypothetical protein BV898_20066, partial [Hypsibius exemplaris]